MALEKEKPKEWCPWKRGKTSCDIRPYRCFDIGDLVEAPVAYPDYLNRYYVLEESQLFLPARIIGVQGDQYLVNFSPAAVAYKWWPNRTDQEISGLNEPDDKQTNFWVNMDRVRPYNSEVGVQPVLGTQSIVPQSWSAFQGAQFTDLRQVDENILWK